MFSAFVAPPYPLGFPKPPALWNAEHSHSDPATNHAIYGNENGPYPRRTRLAYPLRRRTVPVYAHAGLYAIHAALNQKK